MTDTPVAPSDVGGCVEPVPVAPDGFDLGSVRSASPPVELRAVEPSDWDRIMNGQPAASPFHDSLFLATAAQQLGRELRLVAAAVDSADVGGIPLISRRRGPASSVNLLPGLPGLGPVMSARWQAQAMESVRRFSPGWTMLERYESAADVLAELGSDWSAAPDDSYVISLAERSADELRAAMTVNTRRLIRRAARVTSSGPATVTEIAELLPRWQAQTFDRSGTRLLFPPGTVAAMAAAMGTRCPVYRGAVRLDDRPICLFIVCARGDRAYGWHLVSDFEHRQLGAGFRGYWEMIRWASEQGCATIDFGGGPTPGIQHAKQSLGATAHTSFRYERGWRPARRVRETQVRRKASRRQRAYRARQSH